MTMTLVIRYVGFLYIDSTFNTDQSVGAVSVALKNALAMKYHFDEGVMHILGKIIHVVTDKYLLPGMAASQYAVTKEANMVFDGVEQITLRTRPELLALTYPHIISANLVHDDVLTRLIPGVTFSLQYQARQLLPRQYRRQR